MTTKDEKRMMGQFKKATKEPDEYIKYAINESNCYEWYILISGLLGEKDEYKDCEFIFRLNLPKNFPYAPPEFYALTPNGFYAYNKKVCISIGEYHADDYRTTLGVSGFAMELANGLINWKSMGHGINLLTTSINEKINYSQKSRE